MLIGFGIAGTLACSSRVPGTEGPTLEVDGGTTSEHDASAVITDGTETTDTVDTTSDTDTSDTSDTPADTDTGSDETDTTDTDLTDTSSDQTDTSATGPDETDTTSTTDGSDLTETDDTATTDDTTDGSDTTDPSDGAIEPPEGMVVVSSFDAMDPAGFPDGSSSFPAIVVDRADSIGTLVVPFTAGNQQGAWSFNAVGDYCGYELVARIRLVSGFNTTAAAVGRVQLRAWNSGWSNFVGTYDALTGVGAMSQLGEWVEYRMDLDNPPTGTNSELFDSHDLNSVGISFISGSDASAAFEEATFEMDWIGFVPKPGGCPDDGDTTDTTDTTDLDGGVIDDAAVIDDGPIDPPANALLVLTNFDTAGTKADETPLGPGYAVEQGSTGQVDLSDYVIADSVGHFTTPFTGIGQTYGASFGTGGIDATGHELQVRIRRVSEPFVAGTALQLTTWSTPSYTFDDFWISLTSDGSADWQIYTLDIDAETTDPTVLQMVGFQINSGYAGGETVYSTVEYEVDWVAIVPKGAVDDGDGGVPGDDSDAGMGDDSDAGMGDEDASVIDEDGGIDDGDAGVGEMDADVTEDAAVEDNGAIEPPSSALVLLTSFDVDGDDLSGTLLAPGYYEEQGGLAADTTWVVEDSVVRFTVPHTGSGQAYTLFFGVGNVNGVGHELIVRLRVVSDLTGLAPPHIQMSTSSSDGDTVNYSYNDFTVPVDANSDYWNWKEYTLDIDTDANYPEIIQGIGVALNSWYSGSSFGTVEYEIDWVAIVPKP